MTAPSVLLVTDNLRIGGVQRVVVSLANHLSTRGHRVGVLASARGELWEELRDGVVVHSYPGPDKPSLGVQVQQIAALRSLRYDVIHAHQRGSALAARLATIAACSRVVEHVHNTFLPVSAPLTSFRGHRLVACGPAIRDMLVDDYKRPAWRIDTVTNAVGDLASDSPAVDGVRDAIRLLNVARVEEQKDPLRFVDIVTGLQRRGVAVEARWIGDGTLLPSAREHARLAGAAVDFRGGSREIAAQLAWCDVLLQSSRWEGLPLTILEAMTMSRPTIAPDIGSIHTAVRSGYNGHLYSVDLDGDAIAAEIAPLLSRSDLETWGTASRQRYDAEFSEDRWVSEIEETYRRARGRRPDVR